MASRGKSSLELEGEDIMTATVKVIGPSGASVVNRQPVRQGANGAPLGHEGNGKDGATKDLGFVCQHPAGPGQPGNAGGNGRSGRNGGNGMSAYGLTLRVEEFTGSAITLLNYGGDGGDGGDGGRGGDGSDGGSAGKQPKVCRGVVYGGVGGDAGQGGRAGNGGFAGSAGDVKILLGPGLHGLPVIVDSRGGKAGKAGQPGGGGTPGKGGRNSDGSYANAGRELGEGPTGTDGGAGGYGGSLNMSTDAGAKPRSLYITVLPRSHG
jgi:hypothetical protein